MARQEASEAAPVDAADDLPDEMPVEAGALGVAGARLPERCFRGQQLRQALPVEERGGWLRIPEGEQPALVGEEVTDERKFLPGCPYSGQ